MQPNPIRKEKGYSIPSPRPGGVGLGAPSRWYAVCPKCDLEITAGYGYLKNPKRGRKVAKDKLWQHLKTKHKNTWRALAGKVDTKVEPGPEVSTCPVT